MLQNGNQVKTCLKGGPREKMPAEKGLPPLQLGNRRKSVHLMVLESTTSPQSAKHLKIHQKVQSTDEVVALFITRLQNRLDIP